MSTDAGLLYLPIELFQAVTEYLPNRDIKSLRLACTKFSHIAHLRLKRVFLSANPLNTEVFRAIADHEKFRRGIVEIIWDDTRIVDHLEVDDNRRNSFSLLGGMYDLPPRPEHVPEWFERICLWTIQEIQGDVSGKDLEDRLPLETSWAYYQKLLRQQQDVLDSGADMEAFRYGLERFPALRRIFITPAAHGKLDFPLYETPMLRAFPPGFNYPLFPAWPLQFDELDSELLYEVPPWDQDEKLKWRGVCLILHELANASGNGHHISELVIDSYFLETGLNCRVFDQPCEEYNNLVTLLRQPGFSHIDLALFADGQYYNDQAWSSLRSGYLGRALNEASDLKHASLRFTADYEQVRDWTESPPYYMDQWIPLRNFFPIDTWNGLRHFGLSGLVVKVDDLISVLAALPNTLRSVELSFLFFAGERASYYHLLIDLRDKLDWRNRAVDERPVVTVHGPVGMRLRYICFDEAVNRFLYDQGWNPFREKFRTNGCYRSGYAIQRKTFLYGHNGAPMETLE